MIDSICGLHCTGCSWKESHGCGGCIETGGHPFHGECPIALCCLGKGLAHCGECDEIPCDKLYTYSYLDPVHGDKPQGSRVAVCRKWAAGSGRKAWSRVLLTSAGFENFNGGVKENIRRRFLDMLGKPARDAKVLFIPAAAVSGEAVEMAGKCRDELLNAGITAENIAVYHMDSAMSADEAMKFDAIYFTGGDTGHLLRRIRQTGFDSVIKRLVHADKVYVGVSAGSLVATPNIGGPFDKETAGLCLVHAYLLVHCPEGKPPRDDLPLPHIPLTDNQALAVSWSGYELVEG